MSKGTFIGVPAPAYGLQGEYTKLEYIESTGTQYIDTGVEPRYYTRVLCEAMVPTTGSTNYLFGAQDTHYGYQYSCYKTSSGYFAYGFADEAASFSSSVVSNDKVTVDFDSYNHTIITENGEETLTGPYVSFSALYHNLYLFAYNREDVVYRYGTARIYSCKIYGENDALLRSFIPCKNTAGIIGLYDTVNDVFYENAGEGDFVAGPIVDNNSYHTVEYIESTGTQFIDTGIVPGAGYTAQLGFTATDVPASAESWIMSVFDLSVSGYPRMRCGIVDGAYYSDSTNGFYYKGEIGEYTVASGGVYKDTCSISLYLFSAHEPSGAAHTANSKYRLYHCKIYDGAGVIAGNFVPVVRVTDGVAGLYDTIAMEFKENAGTGLFAHGTDLTVNGAARKAKKGYIGIENAAPVTLPSGYTQVEYIKSSGTQYIDTGFNPTYRTKLVMDIEGFSGISDGTTSDHAIFGTRDTASSTSANNFSLCKDYQGYLRSDYFGDSDRTMLGNVDSRTIITKDANVVTAFGRTITNTAVTSGVCSYPLNLFACHNATYPGVYKTIYKLYSCCIYDNGVLVRNFVPCTNPSGEAGLYDTVNSVFYANAGSGAFTIGPTRQSVARQIKKGYIGVGGVARPCFAGEEVAYYGEVTPFVSARLHTATGAVGKYVLFGAASTKSSTTKTVETYDEDFVRSAATSMSGTQYMAASANAGDNRIIFAGGGYSTYANYIDSYDADLTKTLITTSGSVILYAGGARTKSKAVFAGGRVSSSADQSTAVFAYDASLTKYSCPSLPEGYSGSQEPAPAEYHEGCAVFFCSYGGSGYVTGYTDDLTRIDYPTMISDSLLELNNGTHSDKPGGIAGEYLLIPNYSTVYDAAHTRIVSELISGEAKNASANLGNFAIFTTLGVGYDYDEIDGTKEVVVIDEDLVSTNDLRLTTARGKAAGVTFIKNHAALFGGGRVQNYDSSGSYTSYDYSNKVDAFVI